jgi:hypothetical protein
MINLTSSVVTLKSETDLRSSVRDALRHVQLSVLAPSVFVGDEAALRQAQIFNRIANQHFNWDNLADPREFLSKILAIYLANARERGSAHFNHLFEDASVRISVNEYGSVNAGLALVLIRLWAQRAILLPTTFSPNLHAHFDKAARSLNTEVASYFSELAEGSQYSPSVRYTLKHHVKRLLWATDWHSFRDVKLDDLARLHKAVHRARNGINAEGIPIPPYPFSVVLTELTQKLSAKTGLGQSDAERYDQSLRQTIAEKGPIEVLQQVQAGLGIGSELSEDEIFMFLRTVKIDRVADGKGWHGVDFPYPGLERLKIPPGAAIWSSQFDAFIAYWSERYESGGKAKYLTPIADYLFFYLPWWLDKHPDTQAQYPESPRTFGRFSFVKRSADSDSARGDLPKTFYGFLERRYPESLNTIANAKRATKDLFDWMIDEYAGTPTGDTLLGHRFTNPIRDSDIQFVGSLKSSAHKSISHRVSILLRKYLLAIESFMSFVEQESLAVDDFTSNNLKINSIYIDVRSAGATPIVVHMGKVIPVWKIPKVQQEFEASINVAAISGDLKWRHGLISLAGLRLICVMFESGLRGAHLRWLDRTKYSTQDRPELYCRTLLVNTDKVKNQEWTTLISPEAWGVLGRQAEFVSRIRASELLKPVPYQFRKHSRFEDIYPLFVSNIAQHFGKPISDETYRRTWKLVLYCFQEWYRDAFGQELILVVAEEDIQSAIERGESVSDVISMIGTSYTPHSMRSTVISERASFLPLDVVAALVGQSSRSVAAYYFQVDQEEWDKKIQKHAEQLDAYFLFARDNEAYVRPSATGSKLRQAVDMDRRRAAERYGFTTLSLNSQESTYDGDGSQPDGTRAFNEAPAVNLIFRDTHICPLAEECPLEIMAQIREPKRCGLCPYAIRSVDHLPAIQAKQHQLEATAKEARRRGEMFLEAGQSIDEAQEWFERADLDATEAISWHVTERILLDKLASIRAGEQTATDYHLDAPEMLKSRIERVSFSFSEGQHEMFSMLQRIGEANAYPNLQDETVRNSARRLIRHLFGSDEDLFSPDIDPVSLLCARLKAEMDIRKITIQELCAALEGHRDVLLTKAVRLTDSYGIMGRLSHDKETISE